MVPAFSFTCQQSAGMTAVANLILYVWVGLCKTCLHGMINKNNRLVAFNRTFIESRSFVFIFGYYTFLLALLHYASYKLQPFL